MSLPQPTITNVGRVGLIFRFLSIPSNPKNGSWPVGLMPRNSSRHSLEGINPGGARAMIPGGALTVPALTQTEWQVREMAVLR
jgi:hypothetical protein